MRILFLSILSLLLVGCLKGRVTTISDASPPQQPVFTVISKDSVSLRERAIVGHIEKKMSERGFSKASSPEVANVVVRYEYSMGPSKTDFYYDKGGGYSSSTYPRNFEISIIDIEKSKASGKVEVIWQGELYSTGHSADMTRLAAYFIDVLFENYGKTVTNQTFSISYP